jgi:hypothetical protein
MNGWSLQAQEAQNVGGTAEIDPSVFHDAEDLWR